MAHISNEALVATALLITAFVAFLFGLSFFKAAVVLCLIWPTLSLLRSNFRWREMKRSNPKFLALQSGDDEVNTGRIWHHYLAHKRYAETIVRDSEER